MKFHSTVFPRATFGPYKSTGDKKTHIRMRFLLPSGTKEVLAAITYTEDKQKSKIDVSARIGNEWFLLDEAARENEPGVVIQAYDDEARLIMEQKADEITLDIWLRDSVFTPIRCKPYFVDDNGAISPYRFVRKFHHDKPQEAVSYVELNVVADEEAAVPQQASYVEVVTMETPTHPCTVATPATAATATDDGDRKRKSNGL